MGCSADTDDVITASDPGAIVRVTLDSRVGVVLNEIPEAYRDAAAAIYLEQPASFWEARAALQVDHTSYRLVYRNFFYDEADNKGILALPPRKLWRFALGAKGPRREESASGIDAVVVDYQFEAHLLSDAKTPGVAEVALQQVGGSWDEPYELPLDPEFLFQRTGYACLDEDGYPLRSAESENTSLLFDHTCDVESPDEASCHYTEYPTTSCVEALDEHTGRVSTNLKFKRVPYDKTLADEIRVEDYSSTKGPDLVALPDGLDTHRIVYRYFEPDSCALQERCITGTGWRRLLEYDASIKNASPVALTVGEVTDDSSFVTHNVFKFSSCHEHYHYTHYGDFRYGSLPGDKRAFCIESTDRYENNEQTPLTHPYGCYNQGIAAGWGDTYIAGIECNWIDITDLDVPANGITQTLEFKLNPDGFICEGTPTTDKQGQQLFTPTDEVAENGDKVDKPVCEFIADYDKNNLARREVWVPPSGSLITVDCGRVQSGPLRDCGLKQLAEKLSCTPGSEVTLHCQVIGSGPAQVLRVCEHSAALGVSIPCMYREALASAVVTKAGTDVHFTCPEARGEGEPGGAIGTYGGGLLTGDAAGAIDCSVVP
jgi:hypothetical protein